MKSRKFETYQPSRKTKLFWEASRKKLAGATAQLLVGAAGGIGSAHLPSCTCLLWIIQCPRLLENLRNWAIWNSILTRMSSCGEKLSKTIFVSLKLTPCLCLGHITCPSGLKAIIHLQEMRARSKVAAAYDRLKTRFLSLPPTDLLLSVPRYAVLQQAELSSIWAWQHPDCFTL